MSGGLRPQVLATVREPRWYRAVTSREVIPFVIDQTTVEAMPRLRCDLQLYQGDDFFLTLAVQDQDGAPVQFEATAQAQIRATYTDEAALDFLCAVEENLIRLHLPHQASAALGRTAVWDCQLVYEAGTIQTLVFGNVTVQPEVTRPGPQEPEGDG